ncbi:hypothetical protein IWW54_005391, partial [Coemansia sp. RSA 2705]
MSYRNDGRLMCKYGHEQAGVFEEDAEGIMEGSTRRHIRRFRQDSKRQKEKERRKYGHNAQFLALQAMQHIIKLQVTRLVQIENMPEQLAETVKHLWLLYVSKLGNIDVPDLDNDEVDTRAATASQGTGTQGQSSVPASAESSQFTQSQGEQMDTSLDYLMQRFEDDVARDKAEHLEWEQRQEGRISPRLDSPEPHTDTDFGATTTDGDTDPRFKISRQKRGRVKKSNLLSEDSRLMRAESFVRLEYLPAIIYLALLRLRLPVSLADMHYMMVDERIPYSSAYHYVPLDIFSRMGEGEMAMFHTPYPPSVARLDKIVCALQLFYWKHHQLRFPAPDAPLVLLAVIKRLDLSIELYPMAMRVARIAKVAEYSMYSRNVHLLMTAALIVCLKLHYGLDGIERVSQPNAPELDLMPLGDFLAKWRADWVSELSVGAIPYLTAYGEHWEERFADYYKRLTMWPELPRYKAAFKTLGAKYSQVVDGLAENTSLSAEAAARLLPPPIARRFQPATLDKPPESRQKTEQPSQGTSDLAKIIDPLGKSTANSLPNARDPRMPLSTVAESFGQYSEPKLQRGECYTAFVSRGFLTSGPGYMVPTLG